MVFGSRNEYGKSIKLKYWTFSRQSKFSKNMFLFIYVFYYYNYFKWSSFKKWFWTFIKVFPQNLRAKDFTQTLLRLIETIIQKTIAYDNINKVCIYTKVFNTQNKSPILKSKTAIFPPKKFASFETWRKAISKLSRAQLLKSFVAK